LEAVVEFRRLHTLLKCLAKRGGMPSADLFFAALAGEFRVPALFLPLLIREKVFDRVEVDEPEVLNAAAVVDEFGACEAGDISPTASCGGGSHICASARAAHNGPIPFGSGSPPGDSQGSRPFGEFGSPVSSRGAHIAAKTL
jgi:hypothetical protein